MLSALDPNARIVESETRKFTTLPSPPSIGSAGLDRIALTVGNPGDVPYKSVPVTGGIPFPAGALGSSEQLRLLGPGGDEVPLQVRTLGQWLDGSVKWALLDFQADVPPGSERAYTLEYGTEAGRARFHKQIAVHEGQARRGSRYGVPEVRDRQVPVCTSCGGPQGRFGLRHRVKDCRYGRRWQGVRQHRVVARIRGDRRARTDTLRRAYRREAPFR